MADFAAALEQLDFEDTRNVQVEQIAWSEHGCEIQLALGYQSGAPAEHWRVRCAEISEYRILPGFIEWAKLTTQHLLLDLRRCPSAKLSFRGRARPGDVIADLWAAHRELADDWEWFSFSEYLNGMDLRELLASGSGILAEGPRVVLDAYASVLESHGISTSIFAERAPSYFRDGAWQPERSDLQVLLLPPSYIIGAGFEAEQIR